MGLNASAGETASRQGGLSKYKPKPRERSRGASRAKRRPSVGPRPAKMREKRATVGLSAPGAGPRSADDPDHRGAYLQQVSHDLLALTVGSTAPRQGEEDRIGAG